MNIGTVVGLVLGLAVAGCSSDNKGGGGDGGSNDLAMNGSTDFAGSSTDLAGSSTDMAGNTSPDCATIAMQLCTQVQTCTPQLFIAAFENMTICKDVQTKACAARKTAGDNGVMDSAACQAALTASCDSYFAAQKTLPAACKRKLGTVADQGMCSFDSQCMAGEYCYFQGVKAGCPGMCQMASTMGTTCTTDHDCDTDNDFKCAATFMAGPPPTSDGSLVCQKVTYGAQGAACVDGTNMQCANGFACANNACAAILAAGSPCDGAAASLCDARKGDSCQTDPNNVTAKICTPLHYVNIGAQCGMVGTPPVQQNCSAAYALCGGGPPTVCNARVMQGAPCTSAPDNCYPGLTCMAGTCQPPPAVTCP